MLLEGQKVLVAAAVSLLRMNKSKHHEHHIQCVCGGGACVHVCMCACVHVCMHMCILCMVCMHMYVHNTTYMYALCVVCILCVPGCCVVCVQ